MARKMKEFYNLRGQHSDSLRAGWTGIESRWEEKFSAPIYTDQGAHTASCKKGHRFFPWVKAARVWHHPLPSTAEVK